MIFDCDGVLVDSEVLSCACPCDAVARCGIELGVPEASEGVHGRA
jgi:beta-phosphoglucomutase-like phosphatase (HAD superfamily)